MRILKQYFLAAALFLGPALAFTQSTVFTLEQSVLGGPKFQPAGLSQLAWIPGTEKYAYVKEVDDNWVLVAGTPGKAGTETLLSLADFNLSCAAFGIPEATRFPFLTWTGPNTFRFSDVADNYGFDIQTKKAARLVGWREDAANHDVSKQEGVAYTIDQNLYISVPGKENHAVTEDSDPGIRNGESTHRQEFGITKGTFWSPDGKRLAFYRTDERMVSDYPILDFKTMPATSNGVKYPMAGQTSHHATLGVHDLAANKTLYLETGGDPEHYITNITWSPDAKEIWVVEINRDQNDIAVNRYDAASGKRIATVFKETHPKYLEPKHGPIFLPNNPGEFLWFSERDGYNHLYHYKVDGNLLGQLSSGPWIITDFLGFDAKAENIFIETTTQSAVERHVYSLNLKSKAMSLLTPGKGTHRALLHPSGKYLLDIWSSIDVPRIVRIQDIKGKTVQELLKAEDPLASYKLPKPILSQIKAADGKTDLWCRMFQPSNFDPAKKYPVLIYVYNGPSTQLIQDTYLGASPQWMLWLASQGYIVWTVDGRGSANRGLEFEQAIFRHLGDAENDDQMKGVEYLKSLPYVDANRIVVHGWSYGGFMTCTMLMRNPGVFRAGVAGGPVIDWRWYEVMYTERYMDTPQTNPEGYENANVRKYIDDLEAKLMLIHGTSDDVVVWQHSIAAVEDAVKKGVQLDYFPYPGHPHNVRGKDRVHLMTKVLNYLMDNNK